MRQKTDHTPVKRQNWNCYNSKWSTGIQKWSTDIQNRSTKMVSDSLNLKLTVVLLRSSLPGFRITLYHTKSILDPLGL
jgi:hypothetical protein